MRSALLFFTMVLVACGSTVVEPPPDGGDPDASSPDSGAPDSGAPDSGAPDSGAPDSGASVCGDMTCMAGEFCVQRVHAQDAGPKPPTWQCEIYWGCADPTCACAIASFVSASCVSPTCVTESPVMIRCDDLN